MALVPFAWWRPDNATLNSPYASEVVNALCAENSYIPFSQLAPFSSALPAQPVGGITVRDNSGAVHIFAGTATALYKLNNTTLVWEDVSQAATTYGASIEERWRFRQFGDFVVAVNINDAPQVFQVNSSTEFADLGGSPPNARHIAVWGDHLALADDDTVYWSDTNDISNWSTLNASSQTFPDGGLVQGMTDATNPIVFQRQAIRFGTFVPGSLEVFTFLKVHDKRGCAAPYSIASRGAFTFFADSGGFYQIQQDGSILPIGKGKVDRTVFTEIAGDSLAAIYGEIDPFYTRIYWGVRVNSTGDTFDRLLIYDWEIGEWTRIDTNLGVLFPLSSGTVGYTLEGLDALFSSIDDMEISLDSNVWKGGSPVMAAFDSNFALGFFSGDSAEATIVTQEMGDTAAGVQRVTECVPIIDADSFTGVNVSIGSRMRRTDVVNWSAEFQPSSNTGIARKRSRARFHRFKLRIAAGESWGHAQGIEVNAVSAGQR